MHPRAAIEVAAHDAAALLRRTTAALIDVRQPAEYRLDGHVEGSVNICAFSWEHGFYLPSETFAQEVAKNFARDTQIVLLCTDGSLSKGAAATLEHAAFTNVCTLEGGLRHWEAEAWNDEELVPSLVIDEDGEGGLTGAWV